MTWSRSQPHTHILWGPHYKSLSGLVSLVTRPAVRLPMHVEEDVDKAVVGTKSEIPETEVTLMINTFEEWDINLFWQDYGILEVHQFLKRFVNVLLVVNEQ